MKWLMLASSFRGHRDPCNVYGSRQTQSDLDSKILVSNRSDLVARTFQNGEVRVVLSRWGEMNLAALGSVMEESNYKPSKV